MSEFPQSTSALELEQRQHRYAEDMSKRVAHSFFAYPLVWLIIGLGTQWYADNPLIFWSLLAYLSFISLIRALHLYLFKDYQQQARTRWLLQLRSLLILHSLPWGALFAYSLLLPNINFMFYLAFSITALLPVGTDNFASDAKTAVLFIISMLAPAIVVTIIYLQNWSLLCLLLIYLLFMFVLARRQNLSYQRLVAHEMALIKLSCSDELTGLGNYRYLQEQLGKILNQAKRQQAWLSVALIDCDKLAQVAEHHGDNMRELCLQHIATLLSGSRARAMDICARYGSQQFAIVMPNTDDRCAKVAIERLRACIEATPPFAGEERLRLTVSIGCVSAFLTQSSALDGSQLLTQAQCALDKACAQGGNRCESVLKSEAAVRLRDIRHV